MARGCASRSFLVRFLYASRALLIISGKMEDVLEEEAIPMGAVRYEGECQ